MKLFIQLILLVEYLYTKYYYIVIIAWQILCIRPHQSLKIRSLKHSFFILQSNSQKFHVLISDVSQL